MSYEQKQLDTILDIQADFDMAVAKKDWKEAAAMVQQMGDLGYENEALLLHTTLNRVMAEDTLQFEKEKAERMEFGTLSDEAVDENGN